MNYPLKENFFLLSVSMENWIPIILTGPPGSSKTLALRLLLSNRKGNNSRGYFQGKTRVIHKSYQCSELSTSAAIEAFFNEAITIQKNIKTSKVVAILEEIGLAEKSVKNPLKILHT